MLHPGPTVYRSAINEHGGVVFAAIDGANPKSLSAFWQMLDLLIADSSRQKCSAISSYIKKYLLSFSSDSSLYK